MDGVIEFQKLENDSAEIVLALAHNLYGNRLAVASGDHYLRVWDKDGTNWKLTDKWRGHDAEITDVKWNSPLVGQLFGSVGCDGFCNLWLENQAAEPLSGRRFQLIHKISTKSSRPWQSLDFKNLNFETYLALTSYDGNLVILEPRDPTSLTGDWIDWFQSSDFYVLQPIPSPSEEASFHVAWSPEKLPCWTAVDAGLDKNSMGLAVAAMEHVMVFRTDRERKLYLAAELTGAKDIVRGVAWSRGAMRGYDVIATASKDGMVRVYELHTPRKQQAAQPSTGNLGTPAQQKLRIARSGIGAGLAEMSRVVQPATIEDADPSRVRQEVRLVGELKGHLGAVWHVNFSFTGDLLLSTGDDGVVRTWKRDLDGKWEEYAEVDVEDLEQEQADVLDDEEEEGEEHDQGEETQSHVFTGRF